MLRLAGIPISDPDARELVTRLVTDGTPPALELAHRITTCLYFNEFTMDLSAPERNTLLAVLDDPPGTLRELRGFLAIGYRDR